MTNFSRGQNGIISKETGSLLLGLDWGSRHAVNMDVDVSAFLLYDSGKVSSDSDFIFYQTARKTPYF